MWILFKVNNTVAKTTRRSGVTIVNFELNSHIGVSTIDFEQANTGWVKKATTSALTVNFKNLLNSYKLTDAPDVNFARILQQ